MQATLRELMGSVAGVAGFAVFLLPPGYLLAWAADLNGFRRRSGAEQALWAVTLSFPVAMLIANLLGRWAGPDWLLAVFGALALAAVIVAVRERRGAAGTGPETRTGPEARWAALVAMGLAVFCVLAQLQVQVGRHVFVPTTIYDWAVRVPMVRSAMETRLVPPVNPLSSLHGEAVRLRYYYFWYVLCAEPARLLGLSAQEALTASCAWAGVGLLAVLFLAMKYLAGVGAGLRRVCLWLLLPLATIGLDLLPTLAILLGHRGHPFLDMEWWRSDRTPSFLTSMLFSPHHIAGMVCCLLGYLVLVTAGREEARDSWGRLGVRALVAGMCFGACAGDSTFASFLFVLVCLAWALDLLRSKEYRQIAMLAATGVVAYVAARPFLHDLQSSTSAASGLMTLAWRSNGFAQLYLAKAHLASHHAVVNFALRQVLVLVMDFFELGFFFFVLVEKARADWGRKLPPGERALWAMLAAVGLGALCLSSSVTQSANDLGMSAGAMVRLVLVLWAAPWLRDEWNRRRELGTASRGRKVWLAAAVVCLVLGLAGQAYGLAINRLYFPLLEYRAIRRPIDLLTVDRTSERIYDIRAAYAELNRMLPADAHVQFDPVGTMQPALAFYANRQVAASDRGCGTAFGGDTPGCAAVWKRLSFLYGMSGESAWVDSVPVYAAAASVATAADLRTVCSDLRLGAVIVESTDPIWGRAGSWVWTETPVVEERTVRVFACPAAALAGGAG